MRSDVVISPIMISQACFPATVTVALTLVDVLSTDYRGVSRRSTVPSTGRHAQPFPRACRAGPSAWMRSATRTRTQWTRWSG
ncbi:hypothetical protein BD311DRAFT_391845 [Dichomitus squalens]|uniref:Uncharacterized protein n=1 Tax=Dichomitus squalens TaxID=114155 RepID=A0A4Q9N4K2_9APHY|nr:hypothetical protein BD311DRAFT_391845 [Dichomitus squalens]